MDQKDMSKDPKLLELLAQVTDVPIEELLSPEADVKVPKIRIGDEIIVLDKNVDLNQFQVVRREFFAHLFEPAATFNECKFYVNAACLSRFPDVDYVQVLINQETRTLALRPCESGARDSFAWCYISKGKRKPKPITCKLFYAKIVSMLNWNPDDRHKLLGRLIHANGEYLLAFDLTAPETYPKIVIEGEKPKRSRRPIYPADWQDQFGLPYYEHRQSMQINIFDGYAIYAIKEEGNTPQATLLPSIANGEQVTKEVQSDD